MEAILLVVHVILAVALIGIVLIQRSEQDGFGLGSGSGANFMTGRQSANLLTRATAVLAAAFMLNSLVLTILAAERGQIDIVDRIEAAREGPVTGTQTAAEDDAQAQEEGEPLPDAPVAEPLPDAPVAQ